MYTTAATYGTEQDRMIFGEKSDHLGNVRAVVSDIRKPTTTTGDIDDWTWQADITDHFSYYPFGMLEPGRQKRLNTVDAGGYRFGFNGKEKDDEWHGSTGTVYDYGFRIYDARIARFLSVDPLTKDYPMLTPYQFASNMPTRAIDLDGLEAAIDVTGTWWQTQIQEAVDNNDIERATFLAAKAVSTTLKDVDVESRKYAQSNWGGNSPATYSYSDKNPTGLTITYGEGKTLHIEEQRAESSNESSSWFYENIGKPVLEFFGQLDDAANGGGGYRLTWSIGQGQETREAKFDDIETIAIDDIMATVGASNRAAGTKNIKNITTPLKVIVDNFDAGQDLGGLLPSKTSNPKIYKCEACGEVFRDSSGYYVPAEGTPTEKIKTHYK